jgi:hypothetical protein
VALVATVAQFARAAEPLVLEKTIPLEGIEGRIDHMAADVNGGRLFVAALGNKTLEAVDQGVSALRRQSHVHGLRSGCPQEHRAFSASGGR